MSRPDAREEAERLREAEERRHVDLPHRTGADQRDQMYRGGEEPEPRSESDADRDSGEDSEPEPASDRDVPVQDRDPQPADRPTAEGVDRTDARPDRS